MDNQNKNELEFETKGGCGCSGHEENTGCGGNCGCGHDHDDDHEHVEQDCITMELEDGTELVCPVIDIFEVGEFEYIALLNPNDESVFLYKFHDYEDGTVELTLIEDDAEYDLVSEKFNELSQEIEETEE